MQYIEILKNFAKEYSDLISLFVGLVGILLAYFGVFLPIKSNNKKEKEGQEILLRALLNEIYEAMHKVYQIEESYNNNLSDMGGNSHTPKHPPNYFVLEKIITPEGLHLLKNKNINTNLVLGIYSQLKYLSEQYKDKELYYFYLASLKIEEHGKEQYKLELQRLIEITNVLMINMARLWFKLVNDKKLLKQSGVEEFIKFKNDIDNLKKTKWITPLTYKSSFYKDPKNKPDRDFDVILCWKNDWIDCPKQVIEVSKIRE